MDHRDTIARLRAYWERHHRMVQGQRNGSLLILAQWMNEHGVPMEEALQECLSHEDNSGSDPFTAGEIRAVVNNGYRRTEAGGNPWMNKEGRRQHPPPEPHPLVRQSVLTDRERKERVALVQEFLMREGRKKRVLGPSSASPSSPMAPVTPVVAVPDPSPQGVFARMAGLVGLDLDVARLAPVAPAPAKHGRQVVVALKGRGRYASAKITDAGGMVRLAFEATSAAQALVMMEMEALKLLDAWRSADLRGPEDCVLFGVE